MHNYYDILGISSFATDEQIEKAIELGSKLGGLSINSVQQARTYLKNPVARRVYDMELVDFYAANPSSVPKIRLSTKVLRDLVDKDFGPSEPDPVLPKLTEADLAQRIEEEIARSKLDMAKKKVMIFDASIAVMIVVFGFMLSYLMKLKLDAIIASIGG